MEADQMKAETKYRLAEIPREKEITRERFLEEYVKPQRPVVLENLTREWPAREKWSLDYIVQMAGEKTVPLFDNRPISSEFKFNEPHLHMKMKEYVQLLKKGPTTNRVLRNNWRKKA